MESIKFELWKNYLFTYFSFCETCLKDKNSFILSLDLKKTEVLIVVELILSYISVRD